MKTLIGNKKVVIGASIVVVLVVAVSLFVYFQGRVSQDEWNSISEGMSKETVVEYLGNPKSKSIDSGDIKETYSGNLFAAAADTDGELKESFSKIGIDLDALSSLLGIQESGKQVEMYTYKLGKTEHHIYFVDNQVYTTN